MNTENKEITHYIRNLNIDSIELIGCSRSGKESTWKLDRHSHPYFEFIYFFDAKAKIDVPGGVISLVPYDLLVYPPGVSHQEFPDLYYPQEIICIAAHIECNYTLNKSLQISDINGIFHWLFEQSFEEYKKKQEGYDEIIINYIKSIILHINRYFKSNKAESIDILNLSIKFIHDHFDEPITMEKLASISCVSKSYLSRIFLKKLGVSPMRYLNNVRVDIAKKLLINSKLSISDIAAKVGFNDSLYFSRVFKKVTNYAPMEYRKIN